MTARVTLRAAGLVALTLSLERLVNVMMLGDLSYGSTRFIVAVTCALGGISMIAIGAVIRPKHDRAE